MGRTRENKAAIIEDLKQLLSEAQLAVVIDYQGLSVAEITNLRRRLIPVGTVCKVTKNTFMQIAIQEDEQWQPMSSLLNGQSAFLLVKEDIGGAYKAYQEFRKVTKKSEFRGGVMQGQILTEEQVKSISELPPKEQLMAQIAGALNSIATQLARSINEVPTSVARGINEVPTSVGRGINAMPKAREAHANKEDSAA